MKSAALLVLAALCAVPCSSQAPFLDPANLQGERVSPKTGRELPLDQGAMGLQQMLLKLQTRASLMLIVAHPDDEDGGMLTYYSRGQGARVATLTLTRGEGGQNAMTGDFEDALGLIRTQELLAADRYFGADQMFGTEVDFGFSKTKEEAFQKWSHERVLYDAVRAVRLYRPLVIAAVFLGGVTDGHGQHQVSGQIAQEVFNAAGDPEVFPELTREGIFPWAPIKMYARVPSFAITEQGLFDYATNQFIAPRFTNYVSGSSGRVPPAADVTVHEGEVGPYLTNAGANTADNPSASADPEAKLSYVQFARIGLGLQRTQIGPGVRLATAGAYDVSYHRFGSRLHHQPSHEISFFEGMDTSLVGIAGLSGAPPPSLLPSLKRLQKSFETASGNFDLHHPEASAPGLVEAQHELGALLYDLEQRRFPGKVDVLHELRVKQVQLNDAIVLALGVRLTATADTEEANIPQGRTVRVRFALNSRANEAVGVYSESLQGPGTKDPEKLLGAEQEPSLRANQDHTDILVSSPELLSSPTKPYFYRSSIEQPTYQLREADLRNAPATPPPLTAWATLRYHQTEVQVGSVVSAAGKEIAVVPVASISLPSHAQAVIPSETAVEVTAKVQPMGTPIRLELSRKAGITKSDQSLVGKEGEAHFTLERSELMAGVTTLQAVALLPADKQERQGYRSVGYQGLPRTNFFTPATLKMVPVELQLPKRRRVGYLPGTGDAVADNLVSIGLPVTRLTVADLTAGALTQFDTIILGVRTYNAHPDLHGPATQALLEFARSGGNVVIQYQSSEFSGADAPYPLSLGNSEKVVDESTPVRLLEPEAACLRYPNHISSADFAGWVEERGHGFLQNWDSHYSALTETHDPGSLTEGVAPQLPQRGGLITTRLGKGHWTYCAFAIYRQLPEAVPGSFRLLTNLLGLADEMD